MNADMIINVPLTPYTAPGRQMKKQLKPDFIYIVVMNYFQIENFSEVNGKCRKRELLEARQVFMYLAWHYTTATLKYIGNIVFRDHATVLHSVKRISALIDVNDPIARDVKEIKKIIGIRESDFVRKNKPVKIKFHGIKTVS